MRPYASSLLLILALILSGCVGLERAATQLPTARYCQELHYDRVNDDVSLSAKCKAPFGGM
jgi:hypothetical protein